MKTTKNKRAKKNAVAYGQQVSDQLRSLRHARSLSVQAICNACESLAGVRVPPTTWYRYEAGRAGGGSDVPADLYPAIALVFGYQNPAAWLP